MLYQLSYTGALLLSYANPAHDWKRLGIDPRHPFFMQQRRFAITNFSRGIALGDRIKLAGTSRERRTGLLSRLSLAPGSGLWIDPCEAIHTFKMAFPIDVAFLDRAHRVIKVRHHLGPRRICICLKASSVLELPAGTLAATGTEPGDLLQLLAQPGPDHAV